MTHVNKQALVHALLRASKLTRKGTLHDIHLTLGHDTLTLRSTNYEQALTEMLPASTNGDQATCCLPLQKFLDIVKSQPARDIVGLDLTSSHVCVGNARLPALKTEEFPELPALPDHAQTIALPEDFPALLKFVRPAVAVERSRYTLNGICFDLALGLLVATDGRRLHAAPLGTSLSHTRVILAPAVLELAPATHLVLPTGKQADTSKVFLLTANGYLSAIPLEGEFPEYATLVRDAHDTTATVYRRDLLAVVEQALPLTDPDVPSCDLHLNDGLEVRASQRDSKAEFSADVAAVVEGADVTVTLDPQFLVDALRTIPGDLVTLKARKPGEAVLLVSEGTQAWALIMPITVNDAASVPPTPTPTAEGAEEDAA